jgi:NADPH:quinone reductase-like Zn-dependent oxidoreductase
LYGCKYQPKEVFTNLIDYVERNEIRPLVAKTYPLQDIKKSQERFFIKKIHW